MAAALCFASALVLLLSGCASFTTFQTARVVPVNSYRLFFDVGYLNSSQVNNSFRDGQKQYFLVEAGGRAGVAKYLDMGLKLALPGTVAWDAKYQFIQWGGLALSLGLGADYLNLPLSGSRKTHVFGVMVPVYLSMDLTQWLGLYASAKYLWRSQSGDLTSTGRYAAASTGVRLGNTWGIMLEGTYIMRFQETYSAVMGGIAFFFGNAPSAGYYIGRLGHEVRWRRKRDYDDDAANEPIGARVLEVSGRSRVVMISHSELRAWEEGDRACVMSEEKKAACGTVVKVNAAGAVLKMSKGLINISPGMVVEPEEKESNSGIVP